MSDPSETAPEESGSPAFVEIYDTNAQFPPSPEEPKGTKADKSNRVLSTPQIMPWFAGKANTVEHAVQTDLSFPVTVCDDVQGVLNAYTVMAELSNLESPSIEEVLHDSSESENLQQHLTYNYDIPSPPLTDEDMDMLYDSLSSDEQLDDALIQSALHDFRVPSPFLSDIESQLILPEDINMESMSDNEKTEHEKQC